MATVPYESTRPLNLGPNPAPHGLVVVCCGPQFCKWCTMCEVFQATDLYHGPNVRIVEMRLSTTNVTQSAQEPQQTQEKRRVPMMRRVVQQAG